MLRMLTSHFGKYKKHRDERRVGRIARERTDPYSVLFAHLSRRVPEDHLKSLFEEIGAIEHFELWKGCPLFFFFQKRMPHFNGENEDVIEESGFLTSSTRNDAPSREASFAEKQGMFKESKQDARIQEQHKRRQRASVMLLKFLESNGFKDHVNCKKSWCLGFKYTYPLHEAAKQNDKAVVAWLLRFGADSGKRNAKGRTALDLIKDLESHCAVRHILERPQISWQLRGFGHFFSEVQRVDPLAHG
ncbi:unnamed protein product [Effrenium voratum]|nr:unnamed protein product [Effrenium voratum]